MLVCLHAVLSAHRFVLDDEAFFAAAILINTSTETRRRGGEIAQPAASRVILDSNRSPTDRSTMMPPLTFIDF